MFEYTQAEFETQYNIIKDILTNEKIPKIYPKAYILGGQPGAGKSNIQKWLKQKDNNIIAINADSESHASAKSKFTKKIGRRTNCPPPF